VVPSEFLREVFSRYRVDTSIVPNIVNLEAARRMRFPRCRT
jgi:hypothetical protein